MSAYKFGGVIKTVAKWSCSIISGLALLVFLVLALLGKEETFKIPRLAEFSVKPSAKILPAACPAFLAQLTGIKLVLAEESHRLERMEADAALFKKTYDTPDDPRKWGVSTDNPAQWGPGLLEYKRQLKDISEQRQIFAATGDKLSAVLIDLTQKCEL